MLAIFHEKSLVVETLHRLNGGKVVAFSSKGQPVDYVGQAATALEELISSGASQLATRDSDDFQSYTAREMTRRQCAIFDNCLKADLSRNTVENAALICS
jgi:hypothetical protein